MNAKVASFVGVDWGTSSFRLWLLSRDGTALAESRGPEGMLHCATAGFQPVLDKHLAAAGADPDLPVLICGMAGARQGWLEAPYVRTPVTLDRLHEHTVRVPVDGRDIRIMPGLAQADASAPDVMRGEETQLLGSLSPDFSGLVCMPGTHCKWVSVSSGRVERFSTFMTGELFSVVSRHSILMHAREEGASTEPDDATFLAAARAMLADPASFLPSLFSIRAGQLLGFEERRQGAAHLSGLLIGAEVGAAAARLGNRDEPVVLVAAGGLGRLYEAVLGAAGLSVSIVDAEDISRRGLARAAASIWSENP